MSDTPTCPLGDEELGSMAWKIFGSWNCDPYAIALAVVAAERRRLREAFNERIGEACLFDELCDAVDATARRADA